MRWFKATGWRHLYGIALLAYAYVWRRGGLEWD